MDGVRHAAHPHRITARDMELLGKNSKLPQNDERFTEAWAAKLDKVTT